MIFSLGLHECCHAVHAVGAVLACRAALQRCMHLGPGDDAVLAHAPQRVPAQSRNDP